MTHVARRRIFQSGDFLLTDARTGDIIDYKAQKQIIVQRFQWTALVGFCGVAHTRRQYVPEWIVQQLAKIPLEDATERVKEPLKAGVRVTAWDLSPEVEAAKSSGHPQADPLAQVAA